MGPAKSIETKDCDIRQMVQAIFLVAGSQITYFNSPDSKQRIEELASF